MKRISLIMLSFMMGTCVAMAQKDMAKELKWAAHNAVIAATEQWEPQPKVVTPANYDIMIAPPEDAIVLFGGSDLLSWEGKGGTPASWDIEQGVLYIKPRAGGIKTKQSFGDCQLHIEWMIPEGITGESQGRGNTGVFLQEVYEVQILDSYNSKTYANGQAGSIYKQYAPSVNVCQKQGSWNTYDIIFTAPTFKEDGSLKSQARITLLHNGVLVQHESILTGPTEYSSVPRYKAHGKRPIMLQDHGNRIAFRNIWLREL